MWWEVGANDSFNAKGFWPLGKNNHPLLYTFIHIMHFYLFLQGTVEDEDKHALERIKDGEEVSHDYCVLIDKQ